VIDAQSRTIYLSAAVGNATQILRQEVHALSVDDGNERPNWPVDVSGKLGFDPQPHNPRAALSLVKGIVYVATAATSETAATITAAWLHR
jgi:hypothetical protein